MNNLGLNEKVWKNLIDSTMLYDFMLVNAPDIVVKEGYWHDMSGNPIDCNIYHPKYGYQGFATNSRDIILTSYNPIVYQDPQTNQTVYCRYYLPMLCLHEDLTYTNKDGQGVVLVDAVISNQKRLAETQFDFDEIYDRELERKGLTGKAYDANLFYTELTKHVQNLIQLHRSTTTFETVEITWIELAENFLDYVNPENGNKKKLPTIEIVGKSVSQDIVIHTSSFSVPQQKILVTKAGLIQKEMTQSDIDFSSYESKLAYVKQELLKPRNETLKFQKMAFEVDLDLMIDPERDASLFIKQEYARVYSQIKQCVNLIPIKNYSLESIASFILWCDSQQSSDFSNFWHAIQERFNDCQQTYQLLDYLDWLKNKLKDYTRTSDERSATSTTSNIINSHSRYKGKENKINDMELGLVEKWFMQLVTEKNKNNESYLIESEVYEFVERAFCGKKFTDKLCINLKIGRGNGEKGKVIGLFYRYFEYCGRYFPKTGSIDKNHNRNKYIKLLSENFEGWDFKVVEDNFRSHGNWKEITA